MDILFCDQKENFTKCIKKESKKYASTKKYSIKTFTGDIRKLSAYKNCAFVSPANSFGWMDGGIDAVFMEMFPNVQKSVQAAIKLQDLHTVYYRYYLPVGSALIVDVKQTRHLICAPTMWMPGDVAKTRNAYWAMRATLLVLDKANEKRKNKITTLICPGLCTGVGHMAPKTSAKQILDAIRDHQYGEKIPDQSPSKPFVVLHDAEIKTAKN